MTAPLPGSGLGPGPRRQPLRTPAPDPLGRAVRRLLGGTPRGAPPPPAALPPAPASATADAAVAALAQRLDDRGCASGRVTGARVEELSRAFDRLEAKLNAILVAVTATFISTLAGLALLAVRARLGAPGL